MSAPFDRHRDRRGALRVPMVCRARIKTLDVGGRSYYGECTDISVDGMAIRTDYVPQYLERFEVVILTPDIGGRAGEPLKALVEVRRCNEVERGRLYELGVAIIERR